MTKGELRKARKAARAAGQSWHTAKTEKRDDATDQVVFTETPTGYRARERHARRYGDLNGAPESADDC
jgi:hypothetical protein